MGKGEGVWLDCGVGASNPRPGLWVQVIPGQGRRQPRAWTRTPCCTSTNEYSQPTMNTQNVYKYQREYNVKFTNLFLKIFVSDNSRLFAITNKSLLLSATVNEVTRLPGPWLCHKCLRNIVGSQMVNVSVYSFVNVNVDIDVHVNEVIRLCHIFLRKNGSLVTRRTILTFFYCRSLSLKVSEPPFKGRALQFFIPS